MIETVRNIGTNLVSNPVLRWVVIYAVLYFIMTHVAWFRARKVQAGKWRWDQSVKEVVLITLGGLFNGLFLGSMTAWLAHHGWGTVDKTPVSWGVVALEFGIFFVLFDTWFYWWHRLMHIEPIYTLIHRWHHTSMTPTVVSTVNVNPLESLVNGGAIPLFTALTILVGLPVHEATLPFIGGSTFLIGVWIHCGFEVLPRWWNKTWATKWFITATFHDQHHQYYRYNYGGFTTVWDRICGTMRAKYEYDFANPRGRVLEERRREAKRAAKLGKQPDEQVGGPEEVPVAA